MVNIHFVEHFAADESGAVVVCCASSYARLSFCPVRFVEAALVAPFFVHFFSSAKRTPRIH